MGLPADARAARETCERNFNRAMTSPRFRAALVDDLAGTYDEFRAEAGL